MQKSHPYLEVQQRNVVLRMSKGMHSRVYALHAEGNSTHREASSVREEPHLSCDSARASTGKSPCSPTTPSMRLGRMEMTLIRPSWDPVSTVSSSKATSASTELGCPVTCARLSSSFSAAVITKTS